MRRFSLFCLALCAMAFSSLPLKAEVIDDVNYWLHDDLTATVGNYRYSDVNYFYSGTLTKLSIPSHVSYNGKTYTVTELSRDLMLSPSSPLEEIVLPSTITNIPKHAFGELFHSYSSSSYKRIKRINIPANIKSYGDSIFCDRDESIITSFFGEALVEHLTIESPKVLRYYSNEWQAGRTPIAASTEQWKRIMIKAITLKGDAGDTIPSYACKNWSYLNEVNLPKYNTQHIFAHAFEGCAALTSINLSELQVLKSVRDYAFQDCKQLKNAYLPESVTSIGVGIFKGCDNLRNASLPSTDYMVHPQMFEGCKGPLKITLSQNVTRIGDAAFKDAHLNDFALPSKVEVIEASAFKNVKLSGNRHLELSKSVATVGNEAFRGSGFQSLTINSGFYSGTQVFTGSEIWTVTIKTGDFIKNNPAKKAIDIFGSKIQKYTITDGDDIPDYYFRNCTGLEEIDFSQASIQSIGERAFENCTSLKSINTDDATTIGINAFDGCTNLTDVDLINVTAIPDQAFKNCSALKNIYLGKAQTIAANAFDGCNAIAAFSAFNNTYFNTEGGILYNSDKTQLIIFPRASENFALDDYELPASVTSIYSDAFDYCTHLHSITSTAATPPAVVEKNYINKLFQNGIERLIRIYVPEGSIQAYKNAWGTDHCEYYPLQSGTCVVNGITYEFHANLTATVVNGATPYSGDIVIPATFEYGGKTYQVTAIGDNTFDNCTELTSIVLPEGLLRVGNAFGGCVGLTTLTLPSTLTSLGAWAFYHCTGLTEIICKALNPPTCEKKSGMTPFVDVPTTTPLWVPKASVNLYKEAETWKRFKNNTYAFAANCADVNTIDGNSKAFLKPVSVAFVSGRYVYIQDETGTTMLYLNAADEAIYAGAKIAGIEGKTILYSGLPEVKPSNNVSDWTITADGEEPYYQTVTAVPTYDIINQWVKIENVSIEAEFTSSKSTEINLPMADGEIILRNQFRLEYSFSAEKRYDILAAVAINNDVMKLYFIQVLSEYDKPQGLEEVPSNLVQSTKVIRDGQLLILRGDKIYTITGQEIK